MKFTEYKNWTEEAPKDQCCEFEGVFAFRANIFSDNSVTSRGNNAGGSI